MNSIKNSLQDGIPAGFYKFQGFFHALLANMLPMVRPIYWQNLFRGCVCNERLEISRRSFIFDFRFVDYKQLILYSAKISSHQSGILLSGIFYTICNTRLAPEKA